MESVYTVYFNDYKIVRMTAKDVMNLSCKKSIQSCTKKYCPEKHSKYIKEMEIVLYTSYMPNSAESYIENYKDCSHIYGEDAINETDEAVCRYLNGE